MLACPKCHHPLRRLESRYACDLNHSYDISKEGYVNLLLQSRDVPSLTGDTKQMLISRRSILDTGHFDFLAAHFAEAIVESSAISKPLSILDVGCGEGFYLGYVKSHIEKRCENDPVALNLYGMDISKEALKLAARRYKDCSFFLGDVHYRVPISDGSLSVVSTIFAPRNFSEFSRILAPHGRCIVCIPTSRHLGELRSYFDLLKIEEGKEEKINLRAESFSLASSSLLENTINISASDLGYLVDMTPNFWHKENRSFSKKMPESVAVTLSLKVLIFQRKKD